MNFAIKDAGNVTVSEKATYAPLLYSEDANTFNLKIESEQDYAKAAGENVIAFDGQETATLMMEFEVYQFGQMALTLASKEVEGTKAVRRTTKVECTEAGKITFAPTPVAGSIRVAKLADDGQELLSDELTVGALTTGEMTITEAEVGDKFMVFYKEEIENVKSITFKSDSVSSNMIIDADVRGKTRDGKYLILNVNLPNVKPKKSFELDAQADSVSKLSLEFDVFKDFDGVLATFSLLNKDADGNVTGAGGTGASLTVENFEDAFKVA